jgi:predicted DNA-binding transcriptional regulator AlpA
METKPIVWLDLEAVAARYDVTPRSVQNWEKINPDFPKALRFSRRIIRWRLSDLEAFEAGIK